jgi:hypothetical protein
MSEIKEIKCKRCFGRGFYLKAGGYTQADRIECPKCGGSGRVATLVRDEFQGVVTEDWFKVPPPKVKRESLYRKYGVEC